jgi:hypothetical protein
MEKLKLFMVLLGCKPKGRNTEQHDVFFGIGSQVEDLYSDFCAFWPEAEGKIHIDAWSEVSGLENYRIEIVPKSNSEDKNRNNVFRDRLFFINLGGYKENEFEEFHYKILVVAPNISIALQKAKESAFYRHMGFKGAESHIDDKYGVDVDDVYLVEDILSVGIKEKYEIRILSDSNTCESQTNVGYIRLFSNPPSPFGVNRSVEIWKRDRKVFGY